MKKIQILKNSIKNNGIKETVKKCLFKCKNKALRTMYRAKKKKLKNIISFKKYKRIVVFENQFGWNTIMRQRPQQIALASDKDTLFIYGTTYMEMNNAEGIKKIKENLYLVDLVIHKQDLINEAKQLNNKYLMIYSTDYIPMEVLKPYLNNGFKIIYEYVDGIDEELSGNETAKLLRKRQEIIINEYEPYVVTTATKLYDNIKAMNKETKVKLVTNGVEYNHFAQKITEIPEDIKKIKDNGNIIIGYYGALASWFNYDLIKKIANKNKNYDIVLLGLDYDKTLNKSGILDLENVHYLGKKEYEVLPSYLNYFDICIIPFIINEITLSTSPVKVFEYMAAKKPIVTTALPECMKYNSVIIGNDDEDFINKLEIAKTKINDKQYRDILLKEAKENNWTSKWIEIVKFISDGESDER